MNGHTPGPWKIGKNGFDHYAITNGVEKIIAELDAGSFLPEEEDKANARLIAAAPDMAEALKGVLRVADRKTVEFDVVRAALAKAGVL